MPMKLQPFGDFGVTRTPQGPKMPIKLQPFVAKAGDNTVNAPWGNTTHEKIKMMENVYETAAVGRFL